MKGWLIADLHLRGSPSRPRQAVRLLDLWARSGPDDLLIVAGDICEFHWLLVIPPGFLERPQLGQ